VIIISGLDIVELWILFLSCAMFVASDLIGTKSEKYRHHFSFWKETKIENTILYFSLC